MFLTKPKQKEEELILVWIDLRFYFILIFFFLIHTKETHEKMFIAILVLT
jgi:hypothetical protein